MSKIKLFITVLCFIESVCVLLAQEIGVFPDISTVYGYQTPHERELFLYISGKDSFEMIDTGKKYPVLLTFTWDWQRFMIRASDWLYLGPKESLEPIQTLWSQDMVDFDKKLWIAQGEDMTEEGFKKFYVKTKFSRIPTVNYSMDDGLSVAWIARRHLDEFVDKKIDKIDIGFIVAWFYVDAQIIYRGEEDVDVPIGRVSTYKFEVKGKGLLAALYGKKAWVWLSREEPHYVVKYKNEMPRSQRVPYVEYNLAAIDKDVSREEWNALIDGLVEKAKQ